MDNAMKPSVIGIDGGGTNCRFAMLLGAERFDVQLGSANATSNFAATASTLRLGLEDLASAAGLALSDLADLPTFIGAAGVVDQSVAAELMRALPLTNVLIEDDRRTAVVGALGAGDGCVIGIGTGSFLARRSGGVDRLVGGWGLTLGDEASGAYIGRQLLRRTLDVHDCILSASPLLQEVFAELGTASAIVNFAATAKPGDFAQYAPRIVAAASDGDPIAASLMKEGARYIERTLDHLGWQSGERICSIGGLAPHYAPYFSPDLAAQLSSPDGTALDGALALAAQVARAGDHA
jgi:glucosamine kinase